MVLSCLSLMTAETLAILREMHYPLPHPWTHQQSKGLEQGVKQYPVKMCQSNFECQVVSSNSIPSSIVTTSISFSVNPTYHSQEKMKEKPTRLGSSLWNEPAKGKNEILKTSALTLGRNIHLLTFFCSQQPSIEFLRGSTREPRPASIA